MRILCCATSPHPDTIAALDAYAPGYELTNVGGDPYAYWFEIMCRWGTSSDLAIIEHDIEITAEVVPGFEACPKTWCGHLYPPYTDAPLPGFIGCVRFRAEIQQPITAADLAVFWDRHRPDYGNCLACRAGPVPCYQHVGDILSGVVIRRQLPAIPVNERTCEGMTLADTQRNMPGLFALAATQQLAHRHYPVLGHHRDRQGLPTDGTGAAS